MMVKEINNKCFDKVEVVTLKTEPDCCDDWVTTAIINLFLEPAKRQEITLFDKKIKIIGVQLSNKDYSDDEYCFMYLWQADENVMKTISGLDVSGLLVKEIYTIICDEEIKGKSGWLKNHIFSDEDSLWYDYNIEGYTD